MKKLVCILAALCLMACAALGEITVQESEYEAAGRLAAAENGADCACYRASDASIYYIKDGKVYLQDGASGAVAEISELSEGTYTGIAADADGSVYIMKTDADETAKAALICLLRQEGGYYALEYDYPGASMNLTTGGILLNAEQMTGCAFTNLICEGRQAQLMSVLGVFWGSLTGYDEFVLIDSAACAVYTIPAESLFDVYGYANEAAGELLDKISSGLLLSPSQASLSQDGTRLLLNAGGKAWVLDTVTLELTLLDCESGSVGWDGDNLICVAEDGETQVLSETSGWDEAGFGESESFGEDWGAGTLETWG